MPLAFPSPQLRRRPCLALLGLATLMTLASANAAADESDPSIVTFFQSTQCDGHQIYHALERVAPDALATVRSGPSGSRRQKWLLNWLIRTRAAVDAKLGIPTYEDTAGGMFADKDWRLLFRPYEAQIVADCMNESSSGLAR